jgi:hydrogenase maturation protease
MIDETLKPQQTQNRPLVDQIVEAMLYEGYILYPYRASSSKNRQRFTFGRVYPHAYHLDQKGAEPYVVQTQCLVQSKEDSEVSISVRFLHPMARQVGQLPEPLQNWSEGAEPDFQPVPSIRVGDTLHQTWQEVVEQAVALEPLRVRALVEEAVEHPFSFPASRMIEPIEGKPGDVIGVMMRWQAALEGMVAVSAEAVDANVFKLTVRVLNNTPMSEDALGDPEEVVMRTFASTHTILTVEDGVFFSMMDPPADYADVAAACENTGTWPVLVGEDQAQDTLLSSPIILYDHPELAPESKGDLHDGLEIDEILTLRIMTMTDEEKWEMSHVDERARQILQRTEAMSQDDLFGMHGTIRDMQPHEASDENTE